MRRDTFHHAIPVSTLFLALPTLRLILPKAYNVFAACSPGGPSCSKRSDGAALPPRRLSLTCPNCRSSILDIPEDILEIDEGRPQPQPPKRWGKRSNWISRPLNRKDSEASTLHGTPADSSFGFVDLDRSSSRHRRRASVSSEVSDSSSQTKVDHGPPPRSILQHSPSVSSGKASTLTAKRSVKFSDEPVYYDYSYRSSHVCEHPPHHAPHCKLPYDCSGECLFDDSSSYGYDVDMFSFEQPEDIPSERRWGIFSRFVAWLRRRTGRRTYTIEEEKRRPMISRPQPLAPRPHPVEVGREKEGRRTRTITKKRTPSLRRVCG
ncbi:hypothetical protein M0805_000338 [Coniferiporia weirii]|nr:hypothetical protein M0805_000338 [Coniferiporia weirii]